MSLNLNSQNRLSAAEDLVGFIRSKKKIVSDMSLKLNSQNRVCAAEDFVGFIRSKKKKDEFDKPFFFFVQIL